MNKIIKQKNIIYVLRTLLVGAILTCLLSTVFEVTAFAAQQADVTLSVRQIFTIEEGTPENEVFTYRLTPVTEFAPMPMGSDSVGYDFTIVGTGIGQIGPIIFTAPDIYIYEINSITENQEYFTMDRQVYTVSVLVTHDFEVIITLYSNGAKVSEMLYEHSFKGTVYVPDVVPPTPVPPEVEPPVVPTPPPAPSPDRPTGGTAPKTSDYSNPTLWMTLIMSSTVSLLFLFWFAWKSTNRSKLTNS